MSDSDDTLAVGYKRPPVDRQFKPGQSGNPKGRPKGRKNLKTIIVEAFNKKIKVRGKNGTRTVSTLQAMFEVNINKALAGDTHAFARLLQIAEKHGVFNWQPEERTDLTGYNLVMRRLEEMGYGKTRPKSAAGNDAIELQQPASNDAPILHGSTNQKPDGIFGSDK
jgi:hypothetical protein